MLSSWFLAAAENNYIVEKWYELTLKYWSNRSTRDHYFWFHHLFAAGYRDNLQFRADWDGSSRDQQTAHIIPFPMKQSS